MDPKTIATPLSYNQLMTEVREGYSKSKESLIRLRSVKLPDRVELMREFLRYPVFISSAVMKLQAKGVQESVEIAKAISLRLSKVAVDKSQISQLVKSQYGSLLSTLEMLKKHAEADMLKAKVVIRIVRSARKFIRKEIKRTYSNLQSNAEQKGRVISLEQKKGAVQPKQRVA